MLSDLSWPTHVTWLWLRWQPWPLFASHRDYLIGCDNLIHPLGREDEGYSDTQACKGYYVNILLGPSWLHFISNYHFYYVLRIHWGANKVQSHCNWYYMTLTITSQASPHRHQCYYVSRQKFEYFYSSIMHRISIHKGEMVQLFEMHLHSVSKMHHFKSIIDINISEPSLIEL